MLLLKNELVCLCGFFCSKHFKERHDKNHEQSEGDRIR